MLFIFIVLPLVVAGLMPLIGKLSKKVIPDLLTNLTTFFLLAYSVIVGKQIIFSGVYTTKFSWFGEPMNISLSLDGFSLLMLVTISVVSFCVTLFSIDYMEHYGHKANYYSLLLIMIAGMNGLVLSTDLFTIYVFLEVAAIASYGLVAYGIGHNELEASFKYLMLSAVASGFVVLGISIIFACTGSLTFSEVAIGIHLVNAKYLIGFCAALFLMGFGLKAALVPFHAWLPDAHPSAPAPISAMLSGVLIKVSGAYAIIRIFLNVFGLSYPLSTVLMYLGLISIFVGAIIAVGQNDMKRMLAYSSISQIGYVFIGIGTGSPLGIMGGLFHILNHAVFKSLLFLNSGSIERSTGTRELDKMGGLAKQMPLTATTNAIGSLSVAGVPPFNGFWSKLLIIIALVQTQHYAFAVLAVLGSVITLWYYLIIQRNAFFGKPEEIWRNVREAPFWMSCATVILALLCILIGVAFPFVIKTFLIPATNILASGVSYLYNFLGY
ncbi:MAG: NADH-quinone oxidoreductase subunit M [bacterium]|nr:NADH-quinone oxidoreductase subunit M [bacterium]